MPRQFTRMEWYPEKEEYIQYYDDVSHGYNTKYPYWIVTYVYNDLYANMGTNGHKT